MNWTNNAEAFERDIARTAEAINAADAVFVGAGAGLSTAAGFSDLAKTIDALSTALGR